MDDGGEETDDGDDAFPINHGSVIDVGIADKSGDLQPTEQEDKRQRRLLHIVDAQPPNHVNRQE